MVAAWMLYCTGLAALLGLASLSLEGALASRGWAVRGAWVAGLRASLFLPLLGALAPWLPGDGVGAVVMGPVTVVGGALSRAVEEGSGWAGLQRALGAAWALGSVGMLAFLLASRWRLEREARGWRPLRLRGVRVLVSRRTGPAVVGFLSGRIVVPEWVLAEDDGIQRMVLRHEQEHLAARDPRLMLYALATLVLMPWNLPLWWMYGRLRLAIEIDCDRRVLRSLGGTREYGRLLLEVGRRGASPRLAVAAFAETPSFLERRIRHMTASSRSWSRAALWAACALTVTLVACQIPAPGAPIEVTASLRVSRGTQGSEPRAVVEPPAPPRLPLPAAAAAPAPEGQPAFAYEVAVLDSPPRLANAPEVQSTLERLYPRMLHDAGIGGTVVMQFVIGADGRVDPATVRVISSTSEPFAAASARAVQEFRFRPGTYQGKPVRVLIQMPIAWRP